MGRRHITWRTEVLFMFKTGAIGRMASVTALKTESFAGLFWPVARVNASNLSSSR